MSKVISDDTPADRAIHAAPITPALGPDSSVRTGCSAAAAIEMIPPFDWLMYGAPGTPSARTSSPKRRTYRLIVGPRYAFSTVVDSRSYSRNSGEIADESARN